MPPRRHFAGFTLVELLIVIAIMAILAAAILPNARSGAQDQLECAARVLASDLAYARSLAVTHESRYRVTFDPSNSRYILEHSGTNSTLDALPSAIFRNPNDPPHQHIVNLADLPGIVAPVEIARVVRLGASLEEAADVEFGPLGETTESKATVILLTAGEGAERRRTFVSINPVTGLTAIGLDAARIEPDVAAQIDNGGN
ncbi:MAG: prepilin-type N-terminal cleavage/methylation domain-containing protein [Planctomycetia bacterium]|nr:prepilin-type N-terminal cleavage/methylation domain-containing protein [Planctomycetia bacterium]